MFLLQVGRHLSFVTLWMEVLIKVKPFIHSTVFEWYSNLVHRCFESIDPILRFQILP
ncbi:hypothetical protein QQP08_024872 [Theobroma cacao]|nr:hypothetical protein QQP08_024872 [Theobroma cacao]